MPSVAAATPSVAHHFRMAASPISSRPRIRRITHAESGTILLGNFIGVTFRNLELIGKSRIIGNIAPAILQYFADLPQVTERWRRGGETSLQGRW
jgi:hypothetical protein